MANNTFTDTSEEKIIIDEIKVLLDKYGCKYKISPSYANPTGFETLIRFITNK